MIANISRMDRRNDNLRKAGEQLQPLTLRVKRVSTNKIVIDLGLLAHSPKGDESPKYLRAKILN